MKEKILQKVIKLFEETVAEIPKDYFLLPVAGLPINQQRERNYCYELYRLLRNNWPKEIKYKINGEVDKIKHPIIEIQCGKIKPDFIIHNSGLMNEDDNLLIVEVKTIKGANGKGLIKDIQTLNCMTSIQNGYFSSLMLIVGPSTLKEQNHVKEQIIHNLNQGQEINLMFHFGIGEMASFYYLKKK